MVDDNMILVRGGKYVIRNNNEKDVLAEFKGPGSAILEIKMYNVNVFQILEENPDRLYFIIGDDPSKIIPLEEYTKWEDSQKNPSEKLFSELMRIQKG